MAEIASGAVPEADCRLVSGEEPGPESPFWSDAPALELRDTVTGARPRQRTELRLAWTSERFLVRFACEDSDPWATLTERDAPLYQEEVVEVFLDPFGDAQCYFEIEVNPLNTVCDLVLRRSRSGWRKEDGWDCEGLETAVVPMAGGWKAFLSIPFASIAEVKPGDVWKGNFLRIDRPEGMPRELSAWSPTGRGTFHVAERFGTIRFVGHEAAALG